MLHEAVDTDIVKPLEKKGSLTLPDGTELSPETQVVTYVARNFEPYRGFPQAMRAIARLMKQQKKIHVLMVGADDVSYGAKLQGGKTYRQQLLEEVSVDEKRITG